MESWYLRLAAVPHVDYESPRKIDQSCLYGSGAQPRVSRFEREGEVRENLMWLTSTGETSASPASQHGSPATHDKNDSVQTILNRTYEALELPGELIDYHFIIQRCVDELWKPRRRQSAPILREEIEYLCWLDIHLIEAYPETISFFDGEAQRYFHVNAFHHLIRLYDNEGFLQEAVEVADRAARFYPDSTGYQDLRQRLAELEAEDGDESVPS